MDIPSLTTAMTSLNIAKEVITAALGIREFNAVAVDLAGAREQVLKAQEALFAYSTRLSDLQDELSRAKDKLRELERVQDERGKYSLVQLSQGIWVYQSKPGLESQESGLNPSDAQRYVCQGCFDQGKKFVLQLIGTHWHCGGCRGSYSTGRQVRLGLDGYTTGY